MSSDGTFATEAELLAGLRAGDPAAYRRLVERNSANVYNVALKLLGDEQEAEDVLQETFLSAFEAIDRFEGRSQLSTWLYRIAYNASLMRLRKRKQMTTFSLDQPYGPDEDPALESQHLVDWSTLPDDQLLSAEARAEMDRAIAELPETLRSTFVLRDIQGLSGAETAEVLGITVQAVKNRLHRARLRLRERLSDYFAERVRGLHATA
ncbi:MAG TPA: sigma-70 family RNA polymerase sigma factor [Anaerolineae bacterium]|nr:sigma-70 family RNA polymerase sigma factor [Anaerolineae bacterium]